MKLNVKRTALVGLAFMAISAFWQLYDFSVPLMLKNTFQVSDTWAGVVMALDNILALFLLPLFGALSDRVNTPLGRRIPFILGGTVAAAVLMNLIPRMTVLPTFIAALLLLLVVMGTFRSPAVALMPDVTPKPLRSKGNAVINLMGAVGGVIVLALVNFAVQKVTGADGTEHSDYSLLFLIVSSMMLLCAIVLTATVRENRLRTEMEAIHYGETEAETVSVRSGDTGRLDPAVLRSLVLILCSVSLWYMGYNAVTSAFSKYAVNRLGVTEGAAANCVLAATVFAILSYWPVGLISSRLGRKRVIQCGILMLAAGFGAAALFTAMSPLMYVLFALIGIGWASINVNSFPMVVELATGADTGKYTGLYYTFSMAAQVLTPVLSGALLEHVGYWTLFVYAAVCVLGSFATMCLVCHGDSKPEAKRGLEALDVGDD